MRDLGFCIVCLFNFFPPIYCYYSRLRNSKSLVISLLTSFVYMTFLRFCGIIEGVKTAKITTKTEEKSCEIRVCKCRSRIPITAFRNVLSMTSRSFLLLDENLDREEFLPDTFNRAFIQRVPVVLQGGCGDLPVHFPLLPRVSQLPN